MQSSGGVSKFLNTFMLTIFGLFSHSCLYLDIAFLIHSFVYLVVIFWASLLVVLARITKFLIHSFLCTSSFGGGGILMCVWLFSSFIIE